MSYKVYWILTQVSICRALQVVRKWLCLFTTLSWLGMQMLLHACFVPALTPWQRMAGGGALWLEHTNRKIPPYYNVCVMLPLLLHPEKVLLALQQMMLLWGYFLTMTKKMRVPQSCRGDLPQTTAMVSW